MAAVTIKIPLPTKPADVINRLVKYQINSAAPVYLIADSDDTEILAIAANTDDVVKVSIRDLGSFIATRNENRLEHTIVANSNVPATAELPGVVVYTP
jgi:hypothetical protein